jgi:hypothetical protein
MARMTNAAKKHEEDPIKIELTKGLTEANYIEILAQPLTEHIA